MGLCLVQSIHDKASLTPCVYRASQQGFFQWEQAQPHLIGLFGQQSSARQAASKQLAAQLGLIEALRQLPDMAGNAQVAQDPFSKLLDGGVTAQVTAACASRISSSFRSVLAPKCSSQQWYPCLWLGISSIAGFQQPFAVFHAQQACGKASLTTPGFICWWWYACCPVVQWKGCSAAEEHPLHALP